MAHKRCLAASASFADDRTTLHMPEYTADILYIAAFDGSYKEPQSNADGN